MKHYVAEIRSWYGDEDILFSEPFDVAKQAVDTLSDEFKGYFDVEAAPNYKWSWRSERPVKTGSLIFRVYSCGCNKPCRHSIEGSRVDFCQCPECLDNSTKLPYVVKGILDSQYSMYDLANEVAGNIPTMPDRTGVASDWTRIEHVTPYTSLLTALQNSPYHKALEVRQQDGDPDVRAIHWFSHGAVWVEAYEIRVWDQNGLTDAFIDYARVRLAQEQEREYGL